MTIYRLEPGKPFDLDVEAGDRLLIELGEPLRHVPAIKDGTEEDDPDEQEWTGCFGGLGEGEEEHHL